MNTKEIKEILYRVESWPGEAQEELIETVQAIERRHAVQVELTEGDWKIIDERIKRRHIASTEEVQALFDQYRRV